MLKIIIKQGANPHPFLACALGWKKLEGVRKQLELKTDRDSRIRCSYNLVGTETGRLSCSGSVTGSGTNLQTITKQLRYLYQPDPGYYFFQCDLSGADGWTVAARASQLGDPTMLDDYRARSFIPGYYTLLPPFPNLLYSSQEEYIWKLSLVSLFSSSSSRSNR